MSGMVNTSERLINVVIFNKLKMLFKLEPKGKVAGRGFCPGPLVDTNATGE